MRMNKLEWMSHFFRPRPRSQRESRQKREPKEPKTWRLEGRHETVQAHTKGEARALLKRLLFKGKGRPPRLPAGAVISKV